MNDIFRYELPKYLDYNDYFNLAITCKLYYEIMKKSVKRKRDEKIREIESYFPKNIINMVGRNALLESQYIAWNKKWEIEDYLTDIREFSDLPSSISYSRDKYGRTYIFTKVKVTKPVSLDVKPVSLEVKPVSLETKLKAKLEAKQEEFTVITISQKYSDIMIYFASDPKNYAIANYNRGFLIDDDIYIHLQNFFRHGFFSYLDNPYSFAELPLYSKIFII
jgi:hypothetical protein